MLCSRRVPSVAQSNDLPSLAHHQVHNPDLIEKRDIDMNALFRLFLITSATAARDDM